MFITLINDCFDENVKARLGTRVSALIGVTPTFVGVGGGLKSDNSKDPAEYESAGCLIDTLDAAGDEKGIILVNVANRHGKGKKWPNGTPFGYFYVRNTLVVSTIDGLTLSLIKKLQLVQIIHLFDIPTVMRQLTVNKVLEKEQAEHITNTQFRSFEFQPRVAKWLIDGKNISSIPYKINEVSDIPESVWFVDNFGNCKTTLLPKDIGFEINKEISSEIGNFTCYSKLKDVPDGKKAITIGSSGYGNNRFLEIVIQGKSASTELNLLSGSQIF